MRHETAEIATNDTVPCSTLFRVKLDLRLTNGPCLDGSSTHLSFDMLCNVLKNVLVDCPLCLPVEIRTHLLNSVLLHCFLRCYGLDQHSAAILGSTVAYLSR